jgi:hypothetical protein
MRLTNDKIHYLAGKLLKLCQEHPQVHPTDDELVYRTLADVLYNDMKAEADIDDEVDELLKHHRGEIEAMEMDLGMLRTKMKREIAKKRGFVL